MTKHDDTHAEREAQVPPKTREVREGEEIVEGGIETPTSNDVGKQTETKLGPPPTSAESADKRM